MYVCMYASMYVCIYVCMYVCRHISVYGLLALIHICMYHFDAYLRYMSHGCDLVALTITHLEFPNKA